MSAPASQNSVCAEYTAYASPRSSRIVCEQPARHPAAEHVVQHVERFAVRIVAGEAADADRDVGLLDRRDGVPRADASPTPVACAPRSQPPAPGRTARRLAPTIASCSMARRPPPHRRRAIPLGEERANVVDAAMALDRVDAARGLAARAGGRGTAPRRRACAPGPRACPRPCASSSRMTWRSASTSSSRSAGCGEHVAEQVEAELDMPRRQPRVVRGVLLRGEGVHVAADAVDRLRRSRGPSASSVPLNSRCSRKCETPLSDSAGSSRAPTPTQTPTHTDAGLGHPLGDDTDARSQRWCTRCVTGCQRRRPASATAAATPPATTVATAGRSRVRRRSTRQPPQPGPRSPNSLASLGVERLLERHRRAGRCRRGARAGERGARVAPPSPSPSLAALDPRRLDDRGEARPCRSGRCRRPGPRSRRRGRARPRPGRCACRGPSLEMWTRPSRPGRMLTNAPNLVMFTTRPV